MLPASQYNSFYLPIGVRWYFEYQQEFVVWVGDRRLALFPVARTWSHVSDITVRFNPGRPLVISSSKCWVQSLLLFHFLFPRRPGCGSLLPLMLAPFMCFLLESALRPWRWALLGGMQRRPTANSSTSNMALIRVIRSLS